MRERTVKYILQFQQNVALAMGSFLCTAIIQREKDHLCAEPL